MAAGVVGLSLRDALSSPQTPLPAALRPPSPGHHLPLVGPSPALGPTY